ncbi:MAG: hypothetical protein DYG89_11975 [Caldilinea sp. CFX5]|nr:hypothetical protein [Caldilinea sp. CFX5]
MQTITLETDVGQDGALNISIPSGLPPGKVEVVLVIQPKTEVDSVKTHKEQPEWDEEKVNDDQVYTNGSNHHNISQVEQGKRMMELLAIALKGVEWSEIEEGRADDENRY